MFKKRGKKKSLCTWDKHLFTVCRGYRYPAFVNLTDDVPNSAEQQKKKLENCSWKY